MSTTPPDRPTPANRPTPPPGLDRFAESLRIENILRKETVGGILLLIATLAALIAANSPLADWYFTLRDTELGLTFGDFEWHISVGHLAADGLLAVFFFLAGLELKREFVAGELRDPRKALMPVMAAVGGVALPAVIYALITLQSSPEVQRGWAIPVATDIAFALAVLAVIGTHLPAAMRTFLLTLAVVDDLLGIGIIAFFYSDGVRPGYLLAMFLGLAVFGLLAQKFTWFFLVRPTAAWLVLLPIGILVWFFMYSSGVHATVAGVLLAFTIPVRRSPAVRAAAEARGITDEASRPGLAEVLEHRIRPLSTGFAVPVFAFFSAGVAIGGWQALGAALSSPVAIGIIAALIVGKTIGITGATWLVTRMPGITLPRGLAWIDVFGLGILGGIGFTVSLLISELSFGLGSELDDTAKIAILAGSLLAGGLAAIVLGGRNRHYRNQRRLEQVDTNRDGVPDVFQND